MPTQDSRTFPIRFPQAQRQAIAAVLPELAGRLRLDEPNQRMVTAEGDRAAEEFVRWLQQTVDAGLARQPMPTHPADRERMRLLRRFDQDLIAPLHVGPGLAGIIKEQAMSPMKHRGNGDSNAGSPQRGRPAHGTVPLGRAA